MKVRMLVDAPGSPDGVTVNEYVQGEVYNVPDDLGATFIAYELAQQDSADDVPVTPISEPDGVDTANLEQSKQDAGPEENK